VLKVAVQAGEVQQGALVCVIEATRMENEITADKAGRIAKLPIVSACRSSPATPSP
jgi:acetyl-CoA/propionyl-CoA carboxylase, biotin carboxylase, biotin carboxyl carrier protein